MQYINRKHVWPQGCLPSSPCSCPLLLVPPHAEASVLRLFQQHHSVSLPDIFLSPSPLLGGALGRGAPPPKQTTPVWTPRRFSSGFSSPPVLSLSWPWPVLRPHPSPSSVDVSLSRLPVLLRSHTVESKLPVAQCLAVAPEAVVRSLHSMVDVTLDARLHTHVNIYTCILQKSPAFFNTAVHQPTSGTNVCACCTEYSTWNFFLFFDEREPQQTQFDSRFIRVLFETQLLKKSYLPLGLSHSAPDELYPPLQRLEPRHSHLQGRGRPPPLVYSRECASAVPHHHRIA